MNTMQKSKYFMIMVNYYFKENIPTEKKMEKEKNFIKVVI